MEFSRYVELVGIAIEVVGVGLMAVGVAVTLTRYGADLLWRRDRPTTLARRRLGHSILLALEVLVAGDIIRTVAVSPSFESVGVLAIIVLIRTFLSFALEIEINRHPPWSGDPEVD